MVDFAQTEELAESGLRGWIILQLSKPSVRNVKSLVASNLGDLSAFRFDFTYRNIAAYSKRFQIVILWHNVLRLVVCSCLFAMQACLQAFTHMRGFRFGRFRFVRLWGRSLVPHTVAAGKQSTPHSRKCSR